MTKTSRTNKTVAIMTCALVAIGNTQVLADDVGRETAERPVNNTLSINKDALREAESQPAKFGPVASACCRDCPPSNSAMPARSSKNACQSSVVQSSRLAPRSVTISDLLRLMASRTAGAGSCAASRIRSAPASARNYCRA